MSVERRFSLIRHEHTLQDLQDWGIVSGTANWWGVIPSVGTDGVMEVGKYIDFHETDADADDYDYRLTVTSGRLYTSGDVQGGRSLWAGSTSALPALGYANESTSLVLGYSGDFAYGLLAGVLGSGDAWLQAARFDGTATAYHMRLQPRGGTVYVGGSTGNGFAVIGSGSNASTPGYIEVYDGTGTSRGYFGWASGTNVQLISNSGWGLDVKSATNLYLNFNGGTNTYIGNFSAPVRVYGGTGNIADFITDHATNAYLRLFYGSGANLACYWYRDGSGYGFLGPDGAWDIMVGAGTSDTTHSGHVSIPAGYGVYFNGMYGTQYLATQNGSYGSLRVGGSNGGYGGIKCDYSGVACMFTSGASGGFYKESTARWMLYYNYTDDCWAIGSTGTSASYKLYVTGSAYATGTWTASDGRKKENIWTLDGALDTVAKLRGVSYNWKADAEVGQDPTQRHIGVIAQEVQAVVPEAVHYAEDADSYAVDYNGLVGLLIQAVNELKEKVDELETERSR